MSLPPKRSYSAAMLDFRTWTKSPRPEGWRVGPKHYAAADPTHLGVHGALALVLTLEITSGSMSDASGALSSADAAQPMGSAPQ